MNVENLILSFDEPPTDEQIDALYVQGWLLSRKEIAILEDRMSGDKDYAYYMGMLTACLKIKDMNDHLSPDRFEKELQNLQEFLANKLKFFPKTVLERPNFRDRLRAIWTRFWHYYPSFWKFI